LIPEAKHDQSRKFKRSDERYRTERASLSRKYGSRELWSIIDQWPLYVGVQNLARFMAVAKLIEQTLEVPGDIAEFGTWRGANVMMMAKLLRIYDAFGAKEVHCFDTFEGLTHFAPEDGIAATRSGQYKGSLEELRDMIELYELDEVIVHQGLIEQTLPELLNERPELGFSLVYCDTDLYESTKCILDRLHSRLVKGGIFALDDWNDRQFPGESVAVRDFLEEHGSDYAVEHVRHARKPPLLLRKIRT
jgi:hypothetical protein